MKIQNRFLRTSDFDNPKFKALKERFEYLYSTVWRGEPHFYGAKFPDKIKIHWSREWEYPWAVLHGNIKKNYKVLDCGCGGSPLLPYLVKNVGCIAYGIDVNYEERLTQNPKALLNSKRPLMNLRYFYVDPRLIVGDNIAIQNGDMSNINFPDAFFDRVFCISVVEHLDKKIAKKSLQEMVRVLAPRGKLLITMDHDGEHVKSWCRGKYKTIIEWSGLELDGKSDFSIPAFDEIHGAYQVVGFVLKK